MDALRKESPFAAGLGGNKRESYLGTTVDKVTPTPQQGPLDYTGVRQKTPWTWAR